jgi:hypothetical protein
MMWQPCAGPPNSKFCKSSVSTPPAPNSTNENEPLYHIRQGGPKGPHDFRGGRPWADFQVCSVWV